MRNQELDWPRITHLLKLGICASLAVLAGDMLLGWGVSDYSVPELPAIYARYLSVSDGRIFASALLGLIFIPVECLCWNAVYRMIQPYSERYAHTYRAGIIGCLTFGGCGVHVPCCMTVYLLKHYYADNPAAVVQEILPWLVFVSCHGDIPGILFPYSYCPDTVIPSGSYTTSPKVLDILHFVWCNLDHPDAYNWRSCLDECFVYRLDQYR